MKSLVTLILFGAVAACIAQQSGKCSYYGEPGEIPQGWPVYCDKDSPEGFDNMARKTAAPNVPAMCGKRLRVTNTENGRTVEVDVNDKGPDQSVHPDRILDLTYAAFGDIADHGQGIISCSYEIIG